MAVYKDSLINVELTDGQISRSFLNRSIGEGDQNGDIFGVTVLKDGEPFSVHGQGCVGYFTRSDGVTLVLNGETDGNKAWVELPQACYAREGAFTLAIKVSGTGYADTLRIVDGTVVDITTGTISDPSSVVPALDPDYEDAVTAAQEAADTVAGLHVAASLITGTRWQISVTKE